MASRAAKDSVMDPDMNRKERPKGGFFFPLRTNGITGVTGFICASEWMPALWLPLDDRLGMSLCAS